MLNNAEKLVSFGMELDGMVWKITFLLPLLKFLLPFCQIIVTKGQKFPRFCTKCSIFDRKSPFFCLKLKV